MGTNYWSVSEGTKVIISPSTSSRMLARILIFWFCSLAMAILSTDDEKEKCIRDEIFSNPTCRRLLLFLGRSEGGLPRREPLPGQRCSGRNYQDRRCCTPENPCDEGEGDCDGPGDGGGHDGHAGCKGELVCGSNNCKKFGEYYHEKMTAVRTFY
eukprot:TRINITY_DN19263_c0_g1_i1.p1 TRINITY_DN19263_c0_g1~~TRINITY_DN19263_c0_g1_i1.p1  ORF type:complete len:163 (-),score=38.04 TRINITY_DN19263_c0_g1_i1:20-484(-)